MDIFTSNHRLPADALAVNAIPTVSQELPPLAQQLGTASDSQATSTPSTFQEISSFFNSPDAVDWV